jgi:hypothetical protein
MRECRDPAVPCHRVVASAGGLGGFSSLALKRELLHAEGVTTTPARVLRFDTLRWPSLPTGGRKTDGRNPRPDPSIPQATKRRPRPV